MIARAAGGVSGLSAIFAKPRALEAIESSPSIWHTAETLVALFGPSATGSSRARRA